MSTLVSIEYNGIKKDALVETNLTSTTYMCPNPNCK